MMFREVAEKTVQLFLAAGLEEIEVVADCDDFLWPLLETSCRMHGIDFKQASAVFDLSKNPYITDEERKALIASFADPRTFQDMHFYPGVKKLIRINEAGGKLTVKSNAYNTKVGDLKKQQILAAVPGLSPERVEIIVISHEQCLKKSIPKGVTIAMDDNPHIIAESEALVNLIPRTMKRATNAEARWMMRDKHVVELSNLNKIIDCACAICARIRDVQALTST